ncbi:4-hydroxy-tetrahydrodipicolinate synthase [Larkinella arboricola]|uniref:4-hydroxy-tetrahydrodipicolinate synthase n=1 Tax=Larkinella arboricola TaxID=643671 RepID=A0A327WQ87_LARAB|nr:dihydrodipicolinate synthase family protein [Larkinella arboricola]RAJ94119.1 4-hydroxy-tetrahydrodipicolinate synthase [Larkinella arboricola]
MKPNQPISRRALLERITQASLGLVAGTATLQPLMAGDGFAQPDQQSVSPFKSDEKKFVPVMITPFDSNSKIDYNHLSMLIDFYLRAGAKGFFANCLSSEMYFLDNQERIDLTRYVVQHAGRKATVVSTGSFGDTLGEKADFAKKIDDTGVRGVILISSHFALANESDAVLMKNFETFLSMTGNIKLGTYECPVPYKRLIAPDVFKSLVSDKRLVYHKDTSEDIKNIETKLALARGTQLEFYNAHTATAAESLQKGAKGMSPISGNFYPEIHSWLCQYANDPAKLADVNWIQAEIARTEAIISKFYPLSSKYFLKKRGLPLELVCRSKVKSIPPEQIAILDKTYDVFLGWCDRLGIKAVNGPQ